jgi:hypothetical protein
LQAVSLSSILSREIAVLVKAILYQKRYSTGHLISSILPGFAERHIAHHRWHHLAAGSILSGANAAGDHGTSFDMRGAQ